LKDFLVLNDFLLAEDENARKTSRQFKKDLKLYKQSFNLLIETTYFLYDKTADSAFSSPRTAVLLIMPRIIQSMQSVRTLGLKGYYYDKAILERSLIESMGLCAYLASNEEEAKRWLSGKDIKSPKIKLFDHLRNIVSPESSSGISTYGRLSKYVHTGFKGIVTLIADMLPPKQAVMQFGPSFDKQKFEGISPYPVVMLMFLGITFKDYLTKRKLKKISDMVERFALHDREEHSSNTV
jgi:hypothetical protein